MERIPPRRVMIGNASTYNRPNPLPITVPRR